MNGKKRQKSSASSVENPIGPYRNSVSYGRWHASLAVKRDGGGQVSSRSSTLNQEDSSHLSKYFHNDPSLSPSQRQPDSELAFEALRRCTGKEMKVKMTASASQCITHNKDIKRLNQAYLGSEAEVIRGYISKDKSELPDIDLAASQHCSDLRILCAKRALMEKAPELLLRPPATTVQRENPYKKFAAEEAAADTMPMQSGTADRVFDKEGDKDFVKPRTMLRKPSKSRVEKGAEAKMSTQRVFWGTANTSQKVPAGGAVAPSTLTQKLPTTLSELVSGSDFVFNPKYADKLGKLPEFRRQLVPANALPQHAASFRLQSVANFTPDAPPSTIRKDY